MLELLGTLGGIILIDLVLSGDNALVIGAAAAGLPRRQRWYAIVLGGGGAIILRIGFAILATFLLRLPLLQALGGVLLLFIAVRLLMGRGEPQRVKSAEQARGVAQNCSAPTAYPTEEKGFWAAFLTILIADVTMSLDNVLAIGALASENLLLLAGGLLISIILLLVGSALVAELISRLPWLLDVAALALAWTAANMILDDIRLGPVFEHLPWTQIAIPAIAFVIVIVADILLRLRERQNIAPKNVR
ncbi:MAG TPA: YjbE family putative metal transport protein [Ktedonobacteraceae bacterium]|nr:YjbE family putative metal transport protein [Ktedonobacteraceae bacterium]